MLEMGLLNIISRFIKKLLSNDVCVRNDSCPCPNTACERHGRCCECVNFHRSRNGIVYCMQRPNK